MKIIGDYEMNCQDLCEYIFSSFSYVVSYFNDEADNTLYRDIESGAYYFPSIDGDIIPYTDIIEKIKRD